MSRIVLILFGLAALLGLFPVGLRESSLASADTTEAIFATRVLNALQANAADITTWTDWGNTNSFTQNIFLDGKTPKSEKLQVGKVMEIANANGIDKNTIRYLLKLGSVADTGNRIRYAGIQVADDKYSAISNNVVYYTEFRYGKN